MTRDSQDDIREVWRDQPGEPHRPSLDAVRARARLFERKTRRWRNVASALLAVVLVANIIEVVWPGQDMIERSGDLLIIAALVYIWYEFHKHTRISPERLGQTECVAFYRSQLVHQRNLAAQSKRFLLPFVPGITVAVLGGVLDDAAPLSRRIAVVVLGVALFLGIAWLNAHTARRLQREIEALDGV